MCLLEETELSFWTSWSAQFWWGFFCLFLMKWCGNIAKTYASAYKENSNASFDFKLKKTAHKKTEIMI